MTVSTLSEHPLELWAGVECTVNRVADRFSDQLERSGHASRIKDIERLADLGVSTIRYPILWERTAPETPDLPDWKWADERLSCFQDLRLKPIVGLVHHGSGPRYTNLLDPEFPEKLAAFAGMVAERYPWVSDYTPVNEPLATARFSCLYGHWYPHLRDPLMFARALLLQCRGIIVSMKAIRNINSEARLVQTEDLGKTFSTPTLAYQAEFENERRWLTFDLLSGRVVPGTPMWDYFRWLGVSQSDLEWFLDHQMSPDLLGINHYITSERFLDERVARYPARFHGGNGGHTYADLEAVRVCTEGVAGPKAIISEVWARYHLPLAITEVHLGCTREEQLRWLQEVWTAAVESQAKNIDVRAVTVWAAFGTFDWNSLLTRSDSCYESGVFDLRSSSPRPTALAGWVQTIASGKEVDHAVLDSPGWWHRMDRLSYPPVTRREHGVSSSVRTVKPCGNQAARS
jgi:dTDP-4-dehydrorhamnose reductase